MAILLLRILCLIDDDGGDGDGKAGDRPPPSQPPLPNCAIGDDGGNGDSLFLQCSTPSLFSSSSRMMTSAWSRTSSTSSS